MIPCSEPEEGTPKSQPNANFIESAISHTACLDWQHHRPWHIMGSGLVQANKKYGLLQPHSILFVAANVLFILFFCCFCSFFISFCLSVFILVRFVDIGQSSYSIVISLYCWFLWIYTVLCFRRKHLWTNLLAIQWFRRMVLKDWN